ncbi:hypothetical protein [Chondromyces apiculatus]|uniref:Methyltransferase domain-containing protein n=1 Tax=Chondromyces apiculatus DSM 436 TaxID=1192034 RepID=A0A017T4Y8_9BACT|nr:hypothetical protein [Chondromyces apiculatus]EYF03885.1 Hypothetical protein CAP_5149 [Chondromyces apiculatus DSM 436]
MKTLLFRALHRGLASAHRATLRLDRLLSEAAVALCPPGFDRDATDAHYDSTRSYDAGQAQAIGLYPFEERALSAWFPRPPARLFVPGAGGGRELLALLNRGYSVDALEPAPRLADAARQALAMRGRSGDGSVWRESLEAWSAAPIGVYEGIFTGWGVWSHLLRREDRLAALRAFRSACPRGPVLLSFWRREPVFDPEELGEHTSLTLADAPLADAPLEGTPLARVQATTRGLLRTKLLRMPPVEPGTVWRAGLFVHCVSEAELAEEAAACGYRIAHHERDASRYPNAVLMPQS